MHSRITLILHHEPDHDPAPPTVEFRLDQDREAQIWFREADDESARLVGCPECLVSFLRQTADLIAAGLEVEGQPGGRWIDSGSPGPQP